MHPCLHFFSAPPDGATTEYYQISNRRFSDFLRMYYCDFLNNGYRYRKMCTSLVVMCNGSCRYCSASEYALLLISSCRLLSVGFISMEDSSSDLSDCRWIVLLASREERPIICARTDSSYYLFYISFCTLVLSQYTSVKDIASTWTKPRIEFVFEETKLPYFCTSIRCVLSLMQHVRYTLRSIE